MRNRERRKGGMNERGKDVNKEKNDRERRRRGKMNIDKESELTELEERR